MGNYMALVKDSTNKVDYTVPTIPIRNTNPARMFEPQSDWKDVSEGRLYHSVLVEQAA